MLSSRYRWLSDRIAFPIARVFAMLGFKPNTLTLLGFIASIAAAFMFAMEELLFAFYLLLITSFLDLMDGAVAKATERVTKFGGILDSVLDRYADALILIGIGYYLDEHFLLIFIVMVGGLLVSYSRARAEAVVVECSVGIAERAERLIILSIATLLEALEVFPFVDIFFITLIILAIITHFTVIQRVLFTYIDLKKQEAY